MIDIQCLHHDSSSLDRGAAARCQLGAGHQGSHALMYGADGGRVVRTWADLGDTGVTEHDSPQGFPWVRGMPQVAWVDEPAESLASQ